MISATYSNDRKYFDDKYSDNKPKFLDKLTPKFIKRRRKEQEDKPTVEEK